MIQEVKNREEALESALRQCLYAMEQAAPDGIPVEKGAPNLSKSWEEARVFGEIVLTTTFERNDLVTILITVGGTAAHLYFINMIHPLTFWGAVVMAVFLLHINAAMILLHNHYKG